MIEKIPESLESEMAVLGSLLIDPASFYKILNYLDTRDFYSNQNQIIYNTLLKIFSSGKKIDLLMVGQSLEDAGEIEQCGGRAYLASLINSISTASGIKNYAEIIKDKSIRRQLLEAQQRNQSIIGDEEK